MGEDRDTEHGEYGPSRFVALIDILGFAELVRRLDQEPSLVDTIRTALAALTLYGTGPENEAPHNAVQTTVFSDNIVLSASDRPYALGILLLGCSGICLRLLELGFLTRGGIAYGRLAHDSRLVFGDGLVQAAELEAKVAVYPRVVLAKSVVDRMAKLLEHAPAYPNLGRVDFDGVHHLHYLHRKFPAEFYRLALPLGSTSSDGVSFLAIRNAILAAMGHSGSDLRVRSKVQWMVRYFNELATELGVEAISIFDGAV
jgi:hypothetical protein